MTKTAPTSLLSSHSEDQQSSNERSYLNLAAYKFLSLDNLPQLRQELKQLVFSLGLRGTILISPEGINLFVAGPDSDAESFLSQLRLMPGLSDITVKKSWTGYQPFNRMLVKIKKEIIAFGIESVRPAERTSPKLSPEELKEWLDSGKPVTLLDTRNDYEVELGTFRNAVELDIQHFRNFPDAVKKLPEAQKSQPIVMFCTGGIRCEKAGPLMEQLGFEQIYQLDGGILNYFEKCGDAHYDGDCFVFDQRVAVTPQLDPSGAQFCFACQAVLKPSDLSSDRYRRGEYCPHCYRSPEESRQIAVEKRQQRLNRFVEVLPGANAYESRRPMYVARQFAGCTVIDWLTQMHRGLDREYWLRELDANRVVVGPFLESANESVTAVRLTKEGERYIHIQPDCVEPAVDACVRILFEDPAIIVVDKSAPLPAHASGKYFKNTLEYILSQVYAPERLHLAHRLDANTTGIMLISRRHHVAGKLQNQFASGGIFKSYLARVKGSPLEDRFTCDAPISRETTVAGGRYVDSSGNTGAGSSFTALTEFVVVRRYEDGTTLLEVIPHTGRTNQIRLHLYHLGLQIVNDPMYRSGASETEPIDEELAEVHSLQYDHRNELKIISKVQTLGINDPKMCLHAWKIRFKHPVSGEPLEFATALPSWS